MVRLENVKKNYASRCVLDIPQLQLTPGRRYALIGPNGSGKSTLLRLLAGTLLPDEGSIHIPDVCRQSVGYLPQKPYAYGFSVLKNVCIALSKNQSSADERAKRALDEVGMASLLHARGGTLSGGEAQRMAFARMLVQERSLLLLDEPTSATDIAGTQLVEEALLRYYKKTGCTLLFATHALAQAERLADEIILLDHGRILEFGPTAEVLYQSENEQARAFLNFWQLEKPITSN
ncbi:ABC transporter ATP-binding protein [Eubacteriales bacterium OttesenSCG-928-K08]|nr:ABC transporter ATP-binding protein [Eubacteriales bacterium OttesenSCG-928-K08]